MDTNLQSTSPVMPATAPASTPVVANPVVPATTGLSDAVNFSAKPLTLGAAPAAQTAPTLDPAPPTSIPAGSDLISTENATLLPKLNIGIPGVSTPPQPMAATPIVPESSEEKPAPENTLDFSFPKSDAKPDTETAATPETLKPLPMKPAEISIDTSKPAPSPTSQSDAGYADLAKKVDEINGAAPKPIIPGQKPIDVIKQDVQAQQAPKLEVPKPKSSPTGAFPYKIEELLDMVVQKNASDLHISQGYPAYLRIDGDLQPVSKDIIDEKTAQDLIYPLMEDEKHEILEVNREVDFAYAYGKAARFRINAYYERKKVAAAMRLIPTEIRTMEELGLPQIYHEIIKLPQGLVLVTGPTGSGKSTTLAAMIDEINKTRPVHIVTIEDPIEYIYSPDKALIDQREMHEDTHSWEIALRSVLRQDPDVVLVGEMRDFETIQAALTVAETGHLVFATLHTNSASQSIDRVIDVFPEYQQSQVRLQLSNVVEAVIAQRLVPIIGGGRRAVNEIMLATPAVRNLIREGKSEQIDNTIRTGIDVGMLTLEQSLVKLVREGKLTVEDAQQHTTKPDEVVRLIKG